jgi:chromosome segregation ATPase
MSSPTLKNSLSDLASQLSKIQDENDTIRKRYLELEDAWMSLGAECKELRAENADLKADNAAKTTALKAATDEVKRLEAKVDAVHASFKEQRDLAENTKQTLVSEQLELGKKTRESDLLRRESVTHESELRKLREAWNERESRVSRLEQQRNFYEEQLSQLAEAYQGLVDKVSYVASDYSVKQAPTQVHLLSLECYALSATCLQVRVGGDSELLSSYLNRVQADQAGFASRQRVMLNSQPYMSPARSPRSFPLPVTPSM